MGDDFYIKIRAFGLAALYASLAMFALLLTIAAFKFWPHSDGALHHVAVIGTAFSGVVSAVSQARAGHRIINAINHKLTMPPLELIPFFLMSICLILSSWMILGIDRA